MKETMGFDGTWREEGGFSGVGWGLEGWGCVGLRAVWDGVGSGAVGWGGL